MADSRITKEIHRRVFELTLALYRVTDFFPQGEALRKHLREKANEIFGGISEYGHSLDQDREAASISAKISSIKGYLGIARSLRFVRPINLTVLDREYDFLADYFGKELEHFKEDPRPIKKDVNYTSPNTLAKPTAIEGQSSKSSELPTWAEFSAGSGAKSSKNTGPSTAKEKTKTAVLVTNQKAASGEVSDRQKRIIEYIQKTTQAKISDFFTFFGNISSKTIQRDLQDLVLRDVLKKEGEKRWTIYSLKSVQ